MSSCSSVSFQPSFPLFSFFFNDAATTEIYTLSLHDALPISSSPGASTATAPPCGPSSARSPTAASTGRSEEHTSELQSLRHLVCRLLLEKKKNTKQHRHLRLSRHSQQTKISARIARHSIDHN